MVAGQFAIGTATIGIALADGYAMLAVWLMVAGFGAGLIATNIFAVGQIFAGPRAAGSWTVSYTHLDVYKRQTRRAVRKASGARSISTMSRA